MQARAVTPIAVVLAALACGGPSDPTATEVQVFAQPVAPLAGAQAAAVTLGPRGAVVEISADWTVAGNDIDVYATGADCFEIPSALTVASCLTLAQATGSGAKPERLSFPGAAGGAYKVFVVNRGAASDTVTIRLTLR